MLVTALWYRVEGLEGWEVFEPEAGSLRLSMTKLVGLDGLGGEHANRFDGIGVHGGVLQGDARDGGVPEREEEVGGFLKPPPPLWLYRIGGELALIEVTSAGVAKESARGVANHQVPAVAKDLEDVALVVGARDLRW